MPYLEWKRGDFIFSQFQNEGNLVLREENIHFNIDKTILTVLSQKCCFLMVSAKVCKPGGMPCFMARPYCTKYHVKTVCLHIYRDLM